MNIKTAVSTKSCTRPHVSSGVSAANVKMIKMMKMIETIMMIMMIMIMMMMNMIIITCAVWQTVSTWPIEKVGGERRAETGT